VERWPIRTDLGGLALLGAFAVMLIPVILVGLVVHGIWRGLCRCFCGKPIKRADAEVVDVETGIGCNTGNVKEEDGDEK
jgi:hypothetical protein